MDARGTLLLYGLVGLVVAVSFVLRSRSSAMAMVASLVGALLFWPIFLPMLFGQSDHQRLPAGSGFDARITSGERRLQRALDALDGVAEHLLAPQRARLVTLGDGLRSMARRASEMEALLRAPEFERSRAEVALEALPSGDPRTASLDARLRNIDRLERMHEETTAELERALLRVEEIGTQMVLLKFVDDPDRQALRLLDELATIVEGATEGLEAAM